MSRYNIPDPEDLCVCPYDNAHMILEKKRRTHLMKHRKAHRGADFVTCPLNAAHVVPRDELQHHKAHCEAKAMLEQDIIHAQEICDGKRQALNYKSDWEPPQSSEDWEQDLPMIPMIGLGVDPNYLCEENVVPNMTGMSPAEKKSFLERKMQNLRRQCGEHHEEVEPIEAKSGQQVGNARLRLPREQPFIMQRKKQQQARSQQQQKPLDPLALAGIGRGKAPSVVSVNQLPVAGLLGGKKRYSGTSQKIPSCTPAKTVKIDNATIQLQ